jgi:NADH dehydrogenase
VLTAEVIDLNGQRKVILRDGELTYDILVVATGVSHHYFGHENWADSARQDGGRSARNTPAYCWPKPPSEPNPEAPGWLTFVIVAAATGVN